MSNIESLNANQKLAIKRFYTISWGALAAYTAALVVPLTVPLLYWALGCGAVTALTLCVAWATTNSLTTLFQTLCAALGATLVGASIGVIMALAGAYYPFVLPGVVSVAALVLTTWAGQTQILNSTAFARGSTNWAMGISVVVTLGAILFSGLVATTILNAIFAGFLGLWAVLLSVAYLDGQPRES